MGIEAIKGEIRKEKNELRDLVIYVQNLILHINYLVTPFMIYLFGVLCNTSVGN